MAIVYYAIGEVLLTHDTTIGALYSDGEYAGVVGDLHKAIRSEQEPTGDKRLVGSDILTDAWTTFEWLKGHKHEPQWISKPLEQMHERPSTSEQPIGEATDTCEPRMPLPDIGSPTECDTGGDQEALLPPVQ